MVFKGYFFCVEHESFGGFSVEAVADDGIVEAEGRPDSLDPARACLKQLKAWI